MTFDAEMERRLEERLKLIDQSVACEEASIESRKEWLELACTIRALIADWKQRGEEIRLHAAELHAERERVRLLLDAKDQWLTRAIAAEAARDRLREENERLQRLKDNAHRQWMEADKEMVERGREIERLKSQLTQGTNYWKNRYVEREARIDAALARIQEWRAARAVMGGIPDAAEYETLLSGVVRDLEVQALRGGSDAGRN